METAFDVSDAIEFWEKVLLSEPERSLTPKDCAEMTLLLDTTLLDDWPSIRMPGEDAPVVEIVLPSIRLLELRIKRIPAEKILAVVMMLFEISMLLVSTTFIPNPEGASVSISQFFIITPVTLEAETPLPPVTEIAKPAQSRITLFDPAPLKKSAVEEQFMSESKVVLVVNVVPQAGVTACIFEEFSNIRKPANKAVFRICEL